MHFDNGQIVAVAAAGNIGIYKPRIWLETNSVEMQNHYYTVTTNIVGLTSKLKLGENDDSGSGTMRFGVNINSKISGVFGLTQLITANYSNPLYIFCFVDVFNW